MDQAAASPSPASAGDGAGTDATPDTATQQSGPDAATLDGVAPDAMATPGVDPDLRHRAEHLLEVPLDERAAAFDELNRDVVAALRAIEDV